MLVDSIEIATNGVGVGSREYVPVRQRDGGEGKRFLGGECREIRVKEKELDDGFKGKSDHPSAQPAVARPIQHDQHYTLHSTTMFKRYDTRLSNDYQILFRTLDRTIEY